MGGGAAGREAFIVFLARPGYVPHVHVMPAFVAREAQLEHLQDFLEEALGGGLSIAFVTGEAGSGKTALLTEFAARAQAGNEEVLFAVGECNAQTGIGDPYLPFREILEQLTGDVDGKLAEGTISEENAGRLRHFLEVSGRALVEHAPDLVDILIPGGAILTRLGGRLTARLPWAERLRQISQGRSGGREGTGGLEQSHIFEQYTELLRALSAERPLVLVLDDLHWADAASVTLLFHLTRRLDRERVLVLGAYRPADVALGRGGERHPLESVVNEVKRYRGDVQVMLGEDVEEGRRFVDALVNAEAPGVHAAFREELFHHTGGHPLFTRELLHLLRERGNLVRGPEGGWTVEGTLAWDRLPARIEGLIAEQAGRLAPDLREMLAVASVEGQEFTVEVVARVLQREPRDVVRELSGDLEKRHRLVRARGFERVNGGRLALYEFRHNLFQTWFYGALDLVERGYLHESVGRTLEDLYGERLEEVAVRLARHFVEADERAAAVRYLLMAGDRARATFANVEAEDSYDEVLRLLDERPRGMSDDNARKARSRAREGLGDLAELAGDHEAAMGEYAGALEALGRSGSMVARARALRKSAKPLEIQRRHPEAAARLEEAEAALGEARPDTEREWWDEWLQIQVERIWVNYWRQDLAAMEAAAERARPVIERQGTPFQRARFHTCNGLFGFLRDRYNPSRESLRSAEQALQASREGGTLKEVGMSQFQLGFTHLWRLELDEAEYHLEESLETAERVGDRTLAARALIYGAMERRLRGDVEGALDRTTRAEVAAEEAGLTEYLGTARSHRAWAALRRGDEAEARQHAEAALEIWDGLSYDYPVATLALLPLLAVEMEGGRVEDGARIAKCLLDSTLMRLPDPIHDRLEAATDGDPAALRHAVEAARTIGYV